MFDSVSGLIARADDEAVDVEVSGFTMRVAVTAPTAAEFTEARVARLLLRHKLESEAGQWRWFGFHREDERRAFDALATVKGVGRPTAMRILSGIQPAELCRAAKDADVAALRKVKGVGPKVAARIIESKEVRELQV